MYAYAEHEGGAFWCNLPLGHAGAHEPPPHEQLENVKRQRLPPKRLGDEAVPEQGARKRLKALPPSVDPAEDVVADAESMPPSHRPRSGRASKPLSRPGERLTPPRMHVLPTGYLTRENQEQRKKHAPNVAVLAELQLKLPEAMRSAGWQVRAPVARCRSASLWLPNQPVGRMAWAHGARARAPPCAALLGAGTGRA